MPLSPPTLVVDGVNTWAELDEKPTTVAGFGITDAVVTSTVTPLFNGTGGNVALAQEAVTADTANAPSNLSDFGGVDLTNVDDALQPGSIGFTVQAWNATLDALVVYPGGGYLFTSDAGWIPSSSISVGSATTSTYTESSVSDFFDAGTGYGSGVDSALASAANTPNGIAAQDSTGNIVANNFYTTFGYDLDSVGTSTGNNSSAISNLSAAFALVNPGNFTSGDGSGLPADSGYNAGSFAPAYSGANTDVLLADGTTAAVSSFAKQNYGGNKTATGAATTVFTVTIGVTLADTNYTAEASPLNLLTSANHWVTNKTTTTFDVVYATGLTGSVSFDWTVIPW